METEGIGLSVTGNQETRPGTALSLSLSQQEVWLDQRAWPDSTHFNIGGGGFLRGQLDLEIFKSALEWLVSENETMRLVPLRAGGQLLLPLERLPLEIVDLPFSDDPEKTMLEWWARSISRPFELETKPPWRFFLLQAGADLNGVLIQFHHLVMDGWGTSRVLQRWSEIYNALLAKVEPRRQSGPGYLAFIEESAQYRISGAFHRDAEYWNQQFPTLPEPLIERRQNPAHQALPNAELVVKRIHRRDYHRLIDYAAQNGVSPFNIFLAALSLYFARVCHRPDVVVGVPSLNRGGRRYRETLGMFAGVLPILVRLVPGMTGAELIAAIGLTMRGALRHSKYPLSDLARKLDLIRSGHDGFFSLLLSFERQDYQLNFGSAGSASSRQFFSGIARYPLGVTVCEFHDDADVELILEVSPDYFSQTQTEGLGERLWSLVDALITRPHEKVENHPLATPQERIALVEGLHAKAVSGHADTPFIVRFEEQVRLNPGATALVWDAGRLDYAGLNLRASELACRLRQIGVGRNVVVALAIERSAHLVIAILAIAKAGAAFLPLDPDAPVARTAEVLAESSAVAFIFKNADRARLAPLHACNIVIDEPLANVDRALSLQSEAPTAQDLAYVLFTSGSTGRPKGVMIEHGALSRRLAWLARTYAVCANDRTAQATQITFDPSLIELCLPLIQGASVALPPPGRLLPESMAAFAVAHGVTIMAFVPSTMSRFLGAAANLPGLRLRVACCGGEVLSPELAKLFIQITGARLFNVYGPTETTIFATAWECSSQPPDKVLPVGSAVDDTRIYVLDPNQQLLPFGVTGEVFIGGSAVARGYLNCPELTREVFMPDPFLSGHRMYRTGDRGWLDRHGNLNFTGRLDRQIKLRGYRIELGEIEAALLSIDGVNQAAAKLVQRDDNPAIHAWVTTQGDQTAGQMQSILRRRLPSYMIPGGINILEQMPESTAGKVDYAALPAPEYAPPVQDVHQPSSPLEQQLLSLWRGVLKRPALSTSDNFFDAGGDSLSAISLLTGIEKLIGRRVPMYLISERPTVTSLAAALREDATESSFSIDLAPAGHTSAANPPNPTRLYLAASGHGDLLRFQNLARTMANSCKLHMLQPPSASTITTIADLATLYVGSILKEGHGPCYLAGFSVGGLAALETSFQLQRAGVDVKGLILIDTIYPSRLWGGTLFWKLLGWLVRTLHIQDLSLNGRRLGAMLNDPGLVGQVMAVSGYRASAVKGAVNLIKSRGLATNWNRLLFSGWQGHLGPRLIEHTVNGLHGSIFDDRNVTELAKTIAKVMMLADTLNPPVLNIAAE